MVIKILKTNLERQEFLKTLDEMNKKIENDFRDKNIKKTWWR